MAFYLPEDVATERTFTVLDDTMRHFLYIATESTLDSVDSYIESLSTQLEQEEVQALREVFHILRRSRDDFNRRHQFAPRT